MQPDLLDLLGLPITEVGAVQVSVESARLHWPSGATRLTVLVQGGYDAPADLALEVSGARDPLSRIVRVSEGEVRRVRLDLELPQGATPLELRLQSQVPEGASRIRPAWIRTTPRNDPAPAASAFDAVLGALKHAVGARAKRVTDMAPSDARLPVVLEALPGERPIAAQDEALWMPGMPVPEATSLRSDGAPTRPANLVASAERPECPGCLTRQYAELVRATNRCPSCGTDWSL